jgi:uncharacterized protein YfaS (alpha-2-macroglobulin family)
MNRKTLHLVLSVLAVISILACSLPTPRPKTPTSAPTATVVAKSATSTPTSPTATATKGPTATPTPSPTPMPPTAPLLLYRQPERGEELQVDSPLVLTFDQAMDRRSVEGAFSIEPEVDGDVEWAEDRILVFTPDKEWEREAVYRVAVAATAKSQEGIALREDVGFRFTTTGYLEVTQVQPAPGTKEVDMDGTVTVMFNRPVVPLVYVDALEELPDPLTFSPQVEGEGEWLNTSIYVFRPKEGFAPSTTYEVTVEGGLTDTTGGVLSEDYSWVFTTKIPHVVSVSPVDGFQYVAPTSTLKVIFNQPMDTASVESHFTLKRGTLSLSGTFSWADDKESFEFTPDEELARNREHTAQVAKGAMGAMGNEGTASAYVWQFKSVDHPRITKITPTDGSTDVKTYGGVYVTFSAPMDSATLPGNLAISYYTPHKQEQGEIDVTEVYSSWRNHATQVYIGVGLRASSLYTVTVGDGMMGRYGEQIPEGAVSRFETRRLDPTCYFALPDRVGTFNAYTETTTIVGYRNVSRVDFELYEIDRDSFMDWSIDYYAWNNRSVADLSLVNAWSVSVSPELNKTEVKRLRIRDAGGNSLAPGLYYLRVKSPEVSYERREPAGYLMSVSRSNVVVKRTLDSALVWVTDLLSGQPVSGASVTLYNETQDEMGTDLTDEQGVSTASFDTHNMWNALYAIVEREGDLAVSSTLWNQGISPWEFGIQTDFYDDPNTALFYTDRPIYRPGQKVYFKGIVRLDDDAHYSLPPANTEMEVIVEDSQGREVYQETLKLSDMGTVWGELTLDEEASLGYYRIRALYDDTGFGASFRVAEYKKPEYQVEVQSDYDHYVQGDTINVTADATYYFGGPVTNAQVRWAVLSQDYYFQWDGPGWYNWREYEWRGYGYYEDDYYSGYGKLIAEGTGETDGEGRFTFSVPADIADKTNSQAFTLEVTVVDINDQEVSNRTQAVVHKGMFYIGLSPRRYVGQVDKETEIDVKVVDLEQEPVVEQSVQIVFLNRRWYSTQKQGADGRWYWDWEVEETPVYTTTVTSDADGEALAAFAPKAGGSYKARAIAADERGNEIRSATYFWVSSREWISWRRENNDRIELIADKREYKVGDTAEILVPSPFRGPVKALLAIERADVLEYRVIDIETNSDILKIPIVEDHVPNIFVSVVLVKGIDDSNDLSTFKVGYIELPVSTETKVLNVKLTPDRDMEAEEYYRPRETVQYDVQVTDHNGQGVETELSLDLVDLAVLALTGGDRGQSLLDRFYYQRGVGIMTSASLVVSVDRVAAELPVEEEGKGGGGGELAGEGLVRTEFADTAYWNPSVRTDADGHATVEVKLPDNLTTWRLRGRGVTAETLVGEATVDVLSTLDVLVRTVAPRFFVIGDEATLSVIAHNNTPDDLEATVSLEAMGLDLAQGAQTVTIPAKGKVKLDWEVGVPNVEQVVLRASVQAGVYADAVEFTLPVYTYSTPEVVATAGQIESAGERLEAIILPQRLDPTQGELTVQIDPSLAAGMRDGLEYLEHYPYECIEQTVSRWLPNVLTYKALKDLGIENAELEENLPELISEGLQRIYARQRYDGGWGWWGYSKSNPYISAYVLLGLVEAKEAGFTVDKDVIDNAVSYVRKNLMSPKALKWTYQYNWQAFMLYVLAEAGRGDLSRSVSLFEARENLDNFGKAYLAMALGMIDTPGGLDSGQSGGKDENGDKMPGADSERVKALLSDLSSAAILSATGAHWEEERPDWWSMNTDTRSTAIVIDAFSKLAPENAILPNAVRWLMVARKAGHWETTQETAWALIGLTDYMVMTGELEADYTFMLSLNGQMLDEQDIDKENVGQTFRVEVPIIELLEQEVNRVWVVREEPSPGQTGEGRLYYAMYLRYFLPVEDVEARSRGIMVARKYEPVDCDEEGCPAIDGATVGEVIRVRITLVAPNDLHYVVLEDPLPAGCEAVDRSLKTTSVVSEDPSLQNQDQRYGWGYYGWGWWWFTHSETRDEKVALFADYLPRGTYEYTYLIRASVPGGFQTMPTVAYEMYFPEVWGRGDGARFVIADE